MIRISAFADEISPDPREQIEVLHAEGIRHVDLRAAWDTNILDFSDEQVTTLESMYRQAGISVVAIASPIGKTPIDTPFVREVRRLDRAIQLARLFGAPSIRIFSFYPPSSSQAAWPAAFRGEVHSRLRDLALRAEDAGIVLIHENERDIYGDTIARCVDLLSSQGGAFFQAAFDPANFIQVGEVAYPDAFSALSPWIKAVHVKDATPEGEVVPAGEGAADFRSLLDHLRRESFDGVLSLEPHLAAAGRLSGFSGPELFHQAAGALKVLLDEMGWEYSRPSNG